MIIKRGNVCLACLDPVVGREISITRPVVIISNDKNNEFSGTVTVLPITSGGAKRIYPFEVYLPKGTASLSKNSKVKADQIRTIDKNRIVKQYGQLSMSQLEQVERALAIHLCLPFAK